MKKIKKEFKLLLKGKACVFIDWANVYGWKKSLRKEVDPKKLIHYLKLYKKIRQIGFYFGTDIHEKSKSLIKNVKKFGYRVTTKPVKYIFVALVDGQKVYRRKCDFDMEICIDVHKAINKNYLSFIFFSGDGDFEPLYKLLIKLNKQLIVIYAPGHLGREIWNLKRGIFKTEADKFPIF